MLKKKILLGVTGSIAAYKTADLIRQLRQNDYFVHVIMTKSAKEFITPLTLQALSGNPCLLYTSPSPRDATLSRMPSSA